MLEREALGEIDAEHTPHELDDHFVLELTDVVLGEGGPKELALHERREGADPDPLERLGDLLRPKRCQASELRADDLRGFGDVVLEDAEPPSDIVGVPGRCRTCRLRDIDAAYWAQWCSSSAFFYTTFL